MACIGGKPHSFKLITKKWETVSNDFFSGATKLEHSEQKMVCSKCGEVRDPLGKQ